MAKGYSTVGVDVLHPLTRFNSAHCHSWRGVYPRHCILLQDIVAVLGYNYEDNGDDVHISSTNDLSSWTCTRLPYRWTSLSTYQDQLVAVGGRHPSTRVPTNELLTSYNGHSWQSALPAMPTKRYWTSPVSGRSPAILVVAGGRASCGQNLDIVEVLLDNQWSTVAPLPTACSAIQSSFHAGSIYFTHSDDTMYTCICESLICTAQNDRSSTNVWTEIKAPHGTMTIASCASRLITIDGSRAIRGYSNERWIRTTIRGDWKYGCTEYMAAAELPSGGLLVTHKDGVYALTLSVDTFDPDGIFISDVLVRLEAVMDIQVAESVLATLNKQMTELISLWSSGYSWRRPTWRQLLLVLQNEGQQELAQQIEIFMKGSRGDEDLHNSSKADVLHPNSGFSLADYPPLPKFVDGGRGDEDLHNSSKADDMHPNSGFSLADYPPLPKFVDGEKKVLAGFSADNEVSVMYRGERGSLDWEKCGLTLLFESSDHSSEVSECPVRVSASESGAFRYPPRVEPASRVYHIDCPKQLHAPVTIRIKHNVPEEDIPYLHFITCSEDQPPYDCTIRNEGNFTATIAEISFKGFFFFAFGKLKNLVKGLLSSKEKLYAASLHCSVQPTQSISAYSWKVYVSTVKNCPCFKQSIKKYIKEEYEEDVKLEVNQVVSFVDTEKSITAITSCEPLLRDDVHMNPYGSPVIKKVDISRYIDATPPPHIRYDLQVPLQLEGASLKIKITLKGLQKPKNYLYLHLTVPHLSSPLPVSLPHRSDGLSSELESSAHTDYAFSMKNLRVLQIGPEEELHLIEEMSSQWVEAGDLLGFRISQIRAIQENYSRNVVSCCREVMAVWLDDQKGRYHYPPSWEGLCALLRRLQLSTLAQHIQNTVLK